MLSVSKLLGGLPSEHESGTDSVRYSREPRPVVVWNLTRNCSLHCVHCYNDSGNRVYQGELTSEEGLKLIDSIAAFRVPALIFSGGDPLLREDLFTLVEYARGKGIRPILSTNGINIDAKIARRIKDSGIIYVGISLDGGEEVNDSLRGEKGAFKKAVDALRQCREAGLIVGVRFTMSKKTIGELPVIFDLLEKEGVQRGYFSHLVYAGRGRGFSREDLSHDETRKAVDFIFEKAALLIKRGIKKDIVTGSNDADGVYLYLKLKESDPERAALVYRFLLGRGGNSSGITLANIDNVGDVHPDQFWASYTLGNIRKNSFSDIWSYGSNPMIRALRNRKGLVKGRCSLCRYFEICAGNYRVRAEFASGDMWDPDPACYLTDEEIGL